MKKRNQIVILPILLSIITIVTLMAEDNDGIPPKNNGEVEFTDNCFKSTESAEKCIKNIYPNIDLDAVLVANTFIEKAINTITGSRGGSNTFKQDINLTQQKHLIIYADISKVKKPITVNISNAILTQNQTRLSIKMDIEDIKDKIILRNRENKILVEYKIIK